MLRGKDQISEDWEIGKEKKGKEKKTPRCSCRKPAGPAPPPSCLGPLAPCSRWAATARRTQIGARVSKRGWHALFFPASDIWPSCSTLV